jgi:hypothetical protein
MVASTAYTKTRDLLPCEVLDTSPAHKIYNLNLLRHFRKEAILDSKNPIYSMYILPAFDPEWAIAVYENSQNNFTIEKLVAKESIWKAISQQSEKRYTNITRAPLDAEFLLPSISSQKTKPISSETAASLQKAIEFSVKRRNFNKEELKSKYQYLDGTHTYFVAADNSCGFPWWELRRGPAEELMRLGDYLIEFLDGVKSERAIRLQAEKVIKFKDQKELK